MAVNTPGACTKNEAFYLLKKELGIPRSSLIFENFFFLFFYKNLEDEYIPLMNIEKRQAFLQKHKVALINKRILVVKERYPKIGFKLYQNAISYLKEQIKKE